jgi:PAS domain S-box-containing protein
VVERELFQALFDDSLDAIVVQEAPAGRILAVNREFCRITGREADDLIGRVPERDGIWQEARGHWALLRQVWAAGAPGVAIALVEGPGGARTHQVVARSVALNGRPAALSVLRDLAGEGSSRALAAATLESALDAVIAIDSDGTVLEFNPAAERIFGRSRDEAVGCELAELIVPPALRERHRSGLARLVGGGEQTILGRTVETTGMRSDGGEFPVELTITRVDAPGPAVFTGHLRDISGRVAAAEALARSERHRREVVGRIVTAEAEERRRVAMELHDDIVQVLTATLLQFDRLEQALGSGDGPGARRAAGAGREALAAALERTRAMTFALRPPLLESGGLEPALRDLLEQLTAGSGFAHDLRVAPGRFGATVEELVYRTVRELVTNAIRHSGGGTVSVRVSAAPGELESVVVDDGRGFDLADAIDDSRRRLHMGLEAAVQRLSLAGGELTVDSAPGRGAAVRFRLPTG